MNVPEILHDTNLRIYRAKPLTPAEYTQLQADMQLALDGAISKADTRGMHYFETSGADSRLSSLSIIYAVMPHQPVGIIQLHAESDIASEDGFWVFSSTFYVHPFYRDQEIPVLLISSAVHILEELAYNREYNPGQKTILLADTLSMPDTEDYTPVVAGMHRLMTDFGYIQPLEDDPRFLVRVFQPE